MENFQLAIILDNHRELFAGALITLRITIVSFILALAVGTVVGIARSRPGILRRLFTPYVEVFRGTPLLMNAFSAQLKQTSLVSVLAINELTRCGQMVYSRTFRPFEIYTAVAIIYFLMTFSVSLLSRRLEGVFHVGRRISAEHRV